MLALRINADWSTEVLDLPTDYDGLGCPGEVLIEQLGGLWGRVVLPTFQLLYNDSFLALELPINRAVQVSVPALLGHALPPLGGPVLVVGVPDEQDNLTIPLDHGFARQLLGALAAFAPSGASSAEILAAQAAMCRGCSH